MKTRGLYSQEDLNESRNEAENNLAIASLLNPDGSLKNGGITQEAVDTAIVASDGDVDKGGHNKPASLPDHLDIPTGLEKLSAGLHHETVGEHGSEPELRFHTAIQEGHKNEFTTAKPVDNAAPSNAWSTVGANDDKKDG